MSLDTTLYGILAADAGLAALAETRISPVFDETPGETRDRLVYQQIAGSREYSCDGQGLARGRYQITAWSATHAGAGALAEAVRALLSGYHSGSVLGVFVRDQGDVPNLDPDESARQYGKYVDIEIVLKET